MKLVLYFRSFAGRPAPGALDAVSRHLGLPLPPELIALWNQANGCFFPMANCWAGAPAVGPENSFFSQGVYCDGMVAVTEKDGEPRMLNALCSKALDFPSGYLPLVDDAGGNYVLLKITSSGLGEVVYWDHETRETFLAFNDIRSFFASLGPPPDYEQNETELGKREAFPVDLDLIFRSPWPNGS